LLKDGAGGIVELTAEAKRLGVVMSAEDAAAAAKLDDAFKKLSAQVKTLFVQIGAAVSGDLNNFAVKVQEIFRSMIDWIKTHGQLISQIAKATVAVTGFSFLMIGLGNAIRVAATAMGALRVVVLALTAHPLVLITTLVTGAALAFAHWAGWLDKVYAYLGKLVTKMPTVTDQLRDMTTAIKEQTEADARRLALQGQIGANRAVHGNPWGITADRNPPGKPAGNFQNEARRRFNNLIGLLPGRLQGAITGAELPPSVEEGFQKIGRLIGEASNIAAEAIAAVEQTFETPAGLDIARRSTSATALFDTRLAHQIFGGGGDDTQRRQLAVQEKIERNTRGRGGLPVV
jgi:hypothetical protein